MLMALLPVIAIAQERTPAPEIDVEEGYEFWVVRAYGEGEVHLYIGLTEVENPYTIELIEEEQRILFGAYAKAEGCLRSEWVEEEILVPPYDDLMHPVFIPRLNITETDESIILEPVIDGDFFTLRLYIDDAEVGIPFALPRCRVEYDVYVTVIAEGYEASEPGYWYIAVPAAENYVPDVDGDGDVNIADLTAVIDYVLMPRRWDYFFKLKADCDGDYHVTIADVMALIDYLIYGNWQV